MEWNARDGCFVFEPSLLAAEDQAEVKLPNAAAELQASTPEEQPRTLLDATTASSIDALIAEEVQKSQACTNTQDASSDPATKTTQRTRKLAKKMCVKVNGRKGTNVHRFQNK